MGFVVEQHRPAWLDAQSGPQSNCIPSSQPHQFESPIADSQSSTWPASTPQTVWPTPVTIAPQFPPSSLPISPVPWNNIPVQAITPAIPTTPALAPILPHPVHGGFVSPPANAQTWTRTATAAGDYYAVGGASGYEAQNAEIVEGLALLTRSAQDEVACFQKYRGIDSLRESVIQCADSLMCRREQFGPFQPVRRIACAVPWRKWNPQGDAYWRGIYAMNVKAEVQNNLDYRNYKQNTEGIVQDYQNGTTSYRNFDYIYINSMFEYLRGLAKQSEIESKEAQAVQTVNAIIVGSCSRAIELPDFGLPLPLNDPRPCVSTVAGTWAAVIQLSSGLLAWLGQCKDDTLASSLFMLNPIAGHIDPETVDENYWLDSNRYILRIMGSPETSTSSCMSWNPGQRDLLTARLLLQTTNFQTVGLALCRQMHCRGRVDPIKHLVLERFLIRDAGLQGSAANWIREWVIELGRSWTSSLGSSTSQTVAVYEVHRLLQPEDIRVMDELLQGKVKAVRKKFFTLGIAGGDLKQNHNQRVDLLRQRERRRFTTTQSLSMPDTIHTSEELGQRDNAWTASLIYVPLSRLPELPSPGCDCAMNMAWAGLGDSVGEVDGLIYCHLALNDDNGKASYDRFTVGSVTGCTPSRAQQEIRQIVMDHVGSLGTIMGDWTACRAIYDAPPLRCFQDDALVG